MLPSSRASGGGKTKLKKSLDDILENSFHIDTIVPAPEGCSPEQRQIHENRRQKHIAEAEESMLYICRTLHKYLKNGISPLLLREFYQSYLIREGQSKCADKFVEMMRLPEPSESSDVFLQIEDVQLNYEAILQILSAQDATAVVEVQTAITKINDSNVSLIKKQQKKIEYFNDDRFLKWFFYFYIRYPGFASKVDRWNRDAWHVKWAKEGYGYTGAFQRPLSEIDYTFTGPVCDTSHVLDFDPDFLNEMVCVFTIVWRLWLSEYDETTDAPYIKILRENISSRPWNKFFNESFVPTSGNGTRTEPIDPARTQQFFQELLGQCSEEMQDPRKLEQWIGVLTVAGNKIAEHTESVRKCVIKHVLNASGFMHGWTTNALRHIKDAMYEDAHALRVSAQDFGRMGYDVAGAVTGITNTGVRYGFDAARNAWSRPWSRPSGQRFIEVPDNFGEDLIEIPGSQSGVNTGIGMLQDFNPQAPSNSFPSTPSPSQNSSYVRTQTAPAPANNIFGSSARPGNSRFASTNQTVKCTVTFYFNDKIITRFNRPDNTYLMGDISTPLETFKHQQFLGSYDTFDQKYDVIVPMQGGEIIQNAAQSTLRQLINLQQQDIDNLNVIVIQKPQINPQQQQSPMFSSGNSNSNSYDPPSGGGGGGGSNSYDPSSSYQQQYKKMTTTQIDTKLKKYKSNVDEITVQSFLQTIDLPSLILFFNYLKQNGYAIPNDYQDIIDYNTLSIYTINNSNGMFVDVNNPGEMVRFNAQTYEALKQQLDNDEYYDREDGITRLGYISERLANCLYKMYFVLGKTNAMDVVSKPFSKSKKIEGTVNIFINGVPAETMQLTQKIFEKLNELEMESDRYIVKIGETQITGANTPNSLGYTDGSRIDLIIVEKEPKTKSKTSKGGSKTRKRRHNKRTHRIKPRKLMSRRQKYSRRK
jgi:hypothetical protein